MQDYLRVKGNRETQNGKTMDAGYCQKPWLSFERVSLQMFITSKITDCIKVSRA